MHVCDLMVRLGGNVGNTVNKTGCTPAEILILQAIHGADAVINIVPRTNDKRTQNAEWDRLSRIYGNAGDGLMDAGNGDLLEKLFPGAQKHLPVNLKDIGLGHLTNPANRVDPREAALPDPEPVDDAAGDDDGGDDGDS